MENALTLLFFPTAAALGALHALEPGHAKTLMAAYLIGTKGTRRDALLLGLSVTATHSIVVVALATAALFLARDSITAQAGRWLQIASATLIIALGLWMLVRRWPQWRAIGQDEPHRHLDDHSHAHPHRHAHDHDHSGGVSHSAGHRHSHEHPHSHAEHDEDAHARAHAATLPSYVGRGERPSAWQIIAFGAAGGMIPCTAAVTVMLLALTAGSPWLGLLTVLGFSIGLAATLVSIGMVVVAGLNRVSTMPRLAKVARYAPFISAALVIVSGIVGLFLVH